MGAAFGPLVISTVLFVRPLRLTSVHCTISERPPRRRSFFLHCSHGGRYWE